MIDLFSGEVHCFHWLHAGIHTHFLPLNILFSTLRFRMKYHPDDRDRENFKKLVRLRQRLNIFMDIFNKDILSRAGLDASSAPELMKIMDTSKSKRKSLIC